MRRFIISLVLSLFTLHSFASTVPVTNMQNAVSGVMQSKMSQRGFASNDPRWVGTLISAGASIAGGAAGAVAVTAAGVTAPAWVTAAAVVGLGTLFSIGIGLAADKLYKWFVNPDGTISTGSGAANVPAGAPKLVYSYGGVSWAYSIEFACTKMGVPSGWYAAYAGGCFAFDPNGVKSGPYSVSSRQGCEGVGVSPANGVCPAYAWPPSGGVSNKSVSEAVAAVPAAELSKPANPQIVAELANHAWQLAASQPGYAGLPYDVNNPITDGDAVQWQQANLASWPSVGNLLAPQPAPSGGTAATPFTLPTSTSPVVTADPDAATSSAVNPATGAQVNLGSDPGIGAPTLESTPTAQMILAPLLNLFPTLKNFVVPTHSAECPKPSMVLFSKSLVLDGHCTLLETVRPTLYAVMAFVWVVIALFIVLAA